MTTSHHPSQSPTPGGCLVRMVITLLTLVLPVLHSQSTASSLPRQSSTQSEALLTRGSSFISLSSALPLQPGHLLGFSFRSCHSGQLLNTGETQNVVLNVPPDVKKLTAEVRQM